MAILWPLRPSAAYFSVLLFTALVNSIVVAPGGQRRISGISNNGTRTANTPTSSRKASKDPLASAAACLSSSAAWSAQFTTSVTTISWAAPQEYPITYGTGNVYTTIDGIPVASGNFTPTSTGVAAYSSTQVTLYTFTSQTAFTVPDLTCTVYPETCSQLYSSYLSSLGLSDGAPVPTITPAPSNSPLCPESYYRPVTSCSSTYLSMPCQVVGLNVELYFFPDSNKSSNGTFSNGVAPIVVQSIAPGITLTSPSVGLSFQNLWTVTTKPLSVGSCVTCGDGPFCDTSTIADTLKVTTGTDSVTNVFISLAPSDVSTLVFPVSSIGKISSWLAPLLFWPTTMSINTDVDSIVSQIAHGTGQAEELEYIFGAVAAAADQLGWPYEPQQWQAKDMIHPPPSAYYLNPQGLRSTDAGINAGPGAPGCGLPPGAPECMTIFEGEYRPIVSLPPGVLNLRPQWSQCVPAVFGAYDPPIYLTRASTIATPTQPHLGSTSRPSSPSHSSNPGQPHSRPTPLPPTPKSTPSAPTKTSSRGPGSSTYPAPVPVFLHSSTEITYPTPPGGNPYVVPVGAQSSNLLLPSDVAITLGDQPTAQTTASVDGQGFTISRDPEGATVVNGVTLSSSNGETVIGGHTVQFGPGGVTIQSTTSTLALADTHEPGQNTMASGAVFEAGGSTHTMTEDSQSSNVFVLDGSITLTAGEVTTVDGMTLSMASTGIYEDGTFVPFHAMSSDMSGNSTVQKLAATKTQRSSTPTAQASSTTHAPADPTITGGASARRLNAVTLLVVAWITFQIVR